MFGLNDLVQEKRTGKIAMIEFVSSDNSISCIRFLEGQLFQVESVDLITLFKDAHAVCPKCAQCLKGHKRVVRRFYCNSCKEQFSINEIRRYI